MRTTLEITAEAKKLLRRAPVTISAVEKISQPAESELSSWAKKALGFDPFSVVRRDIEQRNESAQQQHLIEALLATTLRAADIEPYDPVTVKQYMDRVEDETTQRPIQLFLKALYPGVEISQPLICLSSGGKVRLHSASSDIAIPIDGSWPKLEKSFVHSRKNSVLPRGLAPVIFFTRLLAHPDTAALRWYGCEIANYRDEIPAYVMRKVRQLYEAFKSCNTNANLKLSFQVVFSAASDEDFPWRFDVNALLIDIGKASVCDTILGQNVTIRGTVLPNRISGNPVLCRDFSLNPLDAVRDAERFEKAVRDRRTNGTSMQAFQALPLYERLTADPTAIPVSLPRCEPFMVATVSSPTHTTREVIEVWDERSFPG